jgi:hypothetical protein
MLTQYVDVLAFFQHIFDEGFTPKILELFIPNRSIVRILLSSYSGQEFSICRSRAWRTNPMT